jgi:hypothetical protein
VVGRAWSSLLVNAVFSWNVGEGARVEGGRALLLCGSEKERDFEGVLLPAAVDDSAGPNVLSIALSASILALFCTIDLVERSCSTVAFRRQRRYVSVPAQFFSMLNVSFRYRTSMMVI